jgi:hypothetical protein
MPHCPPDFKIAQRQSRILSKGTLMKRSIISSALWLAAVCIVPLCGCQQAETPTPVSKNEPAQSTIAQASETQLPFGNDRLKAAMFPGSPIDASSGIAIAIGMWLPENPAKDPSLAEAEEVEITCTQQKGICEQLVIPLEVTKNKVTLMGPETTLWPISAWDANEIIASYGPDPAERVGSPDRCLRHVLTMTFASGAVSATDVPTHETGCEAFSETNSSRLVYGNFYVDTSPANDSGNTPPAK